MKKIFAVIFLLAVPGLYAEPVLPEVVKFNQHIRPILSDRCFFCHGPDPASREADLRFDREEDLRKALKLEDGILKRVTSSDPDEVMPPPKSKLKVTQHEKALLKKWIAQGAPWEKHWAFIPPEKKSPPALTDPQIQNDIDRFVLEKLRASGLGFSPPAGKEQLLRRLYFTLTGLPPKPEAIAAFLADASEQAVEKVIDQLLASPHYGERMATEWLDVARYADSFGFQRDNNRYVWPWRDWVIRQFNGNLPYNDFITWQLAGDLLENPTQDQVLATTFSRLHQQKVEGGTVPEEFRVEYVADRTHTMGTAFLGLTLECARCHDHKYDPLPMAEYYQLFAYFNNIDEAGLYSFFHKAVPTPTLQIPSEGQAKKLAELKQAVKDAETALVQVENEQLDAFKQWAKRAPGELDIPGLVAHVPFDEQAPGRHKNLVNEKAAASNSSRNKMVDGRMGKAVELTGDDAVKVGAGGFRRCDPFSVSLWINTPDHKERAVIFHRSKAWTDSAQQGYQLLIEDGRLSASVIHFWPGNAISIRSTEPLLPNVWHHVVMTYDGSSKAEGLQIYLAGRKIRADVVRDHLTKSSVAGGVKQFSIGERMRDRGFKNGKVDDLRIFNRAVTAPEAWQLFDGRKGRGTLQDYYFATVNEPWKKQHQALLGAYKQLADLENGLTEIMVMKEMPRPRQTHVLVRGVYDAPADEVFAKPPAVIGTLDRDLPGNRLGLAQWLTDRKHPLTARVTVNRYWQMHFGRGLVSTSEDFGSQGALPSHPELLDWLAVQFMESGWDLKALHKLILSSGTYRQTSQYHAAADPDNRLLHNGPKLRLSAEMLRDQALAVSGLLSARAGGVPSKPYDLTESFKPMGHDKGEGAYRRSVYTYWKLTGPSPLMMALDAVKRDVCTVKRAPTTSPLQALVMMNGPQFVEASRVMAEKVMKACPEDPGKQIRSAYHEITSVQPVQQEMQVLQRLYDAQLTHFLAHPNLARAFVGTGMKKVDGALPVEKVAALGTVINGMLNLDKAVTVR